uniref:shikimate O-hydroxycinnamoyltransferase-like n=1 Tax=Erigeron canadensis TaxID=72917 RepID=UPI001CB9B138|nr:shikimate O-hydroxycinnamoyltransferase-like [Erigeron canadensis]
MTMNITIKKSSIISPSETIPDSNSKQLWTSDLDFIVGRINIRTVYIYKPNGSTTDFFDADVMKKALADVLVSFYPVAGRLDRDESTGRMVINCNGEGVLFVEAESDSTLDDLGEFTPSAELQRLTPFVDESDDLSSYPLFSAQVTHFKCGGVALGCGLLHTISDGLSAIHFINTWSEVARGVPITTHPFIDRTLLRNREPPAPTHDHIEYQPPPSLITQSSPSKCSTTILKLTRDQLDTLKAKTKRDNEHIPSTYEVLAAHIWQCVCKARRLPDDQLTKLHTATDGRSRLIPRIPPGFLGNVIFTMAVVAKSGDVKSKSLSQVTEMIHNALNKMNNDYMRSAIDYLAVQPDLTSLVRGPGYFASPNLNVNSWTRLPAYDADFGWGRPVFMGPACILHGGTIFILPSPKKDGSVSLAVSLDANEQPLFKKLLYHEL